MAKLVLKNPYVYMNSTVLTSYVREITLTYTAEDVDATCGGDDSKARLAGLKDWSLGLTLAQDFTNNTVDSVMYAAVGTTTAWTIRATTSAVGANNPAYTGTGILFDYPILSGAIGDLATAAITVNCSNGSVLARGTT